MVPKRPNRMNPKNPSGRSIAQGDTSRLRGWPPPSVLPVPVYSPRVAAMMPVTPLSMPAA
jgi:hypothetical protein